MSQKKPARWSYLIAIGLLDLVFTIYLFWGEAVNNQARWMNVIGVQLLTIILVLLWLVTISRLKWRVRFIVIAISVVLAFAISQMVRVKEVTGDVLPILEWRWTTPVDEQLPNSIETGIVSDQLDPTD